MSKQVKEWSAKDGVFRMSSRNWMPDNVIKANRDAVRTYSEIEAIKVPGDRFKSLREAFEKTKLGKKMPWGTGLRVTSFRSTIS